jgi:peroxiredoxin
MQIVRIFKYTFVFILPVLLFITFTVDKDVFAQSDREKAPEFVLNDMNGKKVGLSDFKGKPVLLNFWATWCGYCRRERPHLNSLYHSYKDKGLVILSVSTDRSVDKVRNYLKGVPADFIVLSDSDGRTASKYGIRGYPSSFLIDRNGFVKQAFAGYRDWTNVSSRKMIDELIEGE